MPGFLDIHVTQRKNGQEVAWFRDTLGRRVGTSMALRNDPRAITSAEQMAWLANYYIDLQQEQLDDAIGSNGAPMPGLKSNRRKRWSTSRQQWVEYGLADPQHGYAGEKARAGLQPKRDLWGPGNSLTVQRKMRQKTTTFLARLGIAPPAVRTVTLGAAHMRNDIRITYCDAQMAKIGITTQASRIKALANERRAPWWGLSPASSQKFAAALATVYGGAMEDYLARMGLVDSSNYLVRLARLLNSRRTVLRQLVA